MSKMNFNGEFDATSLKQGGKPVATEEYVDEKGIHYFDKFVTGEKLDEQMAIGQIAYCDYGSVVVSGGGIPSSVVIKFTQNANRAIYLRNIYIRYVDTNNVEQTYDYTFTSKQFSQVGQAVDLGGLDWRVEDPNASLYFNNNNTYGQQFGSSSQPASNLTLTTVDLAGCTVKEVRITACGASSTNARLYVSAGADAWLYHEGESDESTFKVLSANTTSDPATFTHGEGSTPGTGETITFSRTFVKRVDTEALLDEIPPIESVVYVNLGDNRLYRYNGTTLVELSKVLELGTTSTTAYRGDLGSDNRTRIFDILNNKLPNSNLEEITWSDLKDKRDNGELDPGKSYRITDYECTTTQTNTSSAGHQFDIIVTADSANKLNEVARACLHEGDTYFANSKLEAWKLWYSLDNDFGKFVWADTYGIIVPTGSDNNKLYLRDPSGDSPDSPYSYKWVADSSNRKYTNTENPTIGTKAYDFPSGSMGAEYSVSALHQETGKGVIYRMIDEFGNDVPYDFKNILFTKSDKYTNAYTFTYTASSTIKDASLLASKKCYSNVMKEYINSSKQTLNFNVFYSTTSSFECYNNTFGNTCNGNTFAYRCYNNTFNNSCSNNTFNDSCYGNTFGTGCSSNTFSYYFYFNTFNNGCSSNTFGRVCLYNIFGNYCRSNTFGNSCSYNTFNNDCSNNNFIGSCSSNTFLSGCSSNTFDTSCSSNTFNNSCSSNTFGTACSYNLFGNNCSYNTFGAGNMENTLGNSCSYNTFGDSSAAIDCCRSIILDNNCSYLYINSTDTTGTSDNYLQNVHVHTGVSGSSSENRKTLTVPDRNLAYETNFIADGSNDIIV